MVSNSVDALVDWYVVRPVYHSINEIHAANGWEPEPDVHFGRLPQSYIQRHALFISHGAEPVMVTNGDTPQNFYPIGSYL